MTNTPIAKTILIVDDEPEIVDIFATEFRDTGRYKVITASNGTEAFVHCRNNRPDVIVSDFKMPKMSGAELHAAVRKTADSAKTPIIFMTGHSEEVRKAIGVDGLAYILEKPCTFADVLLMVDASVSDPQSQPTTTATAHGKTEAKVIADEKVDWDEPLVREVCKAVSGSVAALSQSTGVDTSMSFLFGTQTLSVQVCCKIPVQFKDQLWTLSLGFSDATFQKFIHKVMGSSAGGRLNGFEGTALETLKSALTSLDEVLTTKSAKVLTEQGAMSGPEWNAESFGKGQPNKRVISFKSPFGIFYLLVHQTRSAIA